MKNTSHSFPSLPSDALAFWAALHPHPKNGFFLGPLSGEKSDVFMSAAEPTRIYQANVAQTPQLLARIRQSFKKGADTPRFVGIFGFEAGRAFDAGLARLHRKPNLLKTPAAIFGDFPAVVKIDFKKEKTILFQKRRDKKLEERVQELLKSKSQKEEEREKNKSRKKFHFPNEKTFSRMVLRAKEAIAAGDIYQANLSLRFQAKFNGNPLDVYRRLYERNPSPYSCLFKFGDNWLVSSSPELLLKVQGRKIETRPIAGTRPRGKTHSLDRRRQGQLLLSPKERAEHIMLVDLERNDVGRVCVPGSVKVTDRFAVERYSHVMHIVSQVEGRLSPQKNSVDALRALFPGGTITGCPKIRSVELIEEIEKIARGPFYGSAGFFCGNGDAVFNILIRTALMKHQQVFIQAGAGIVADSNPKREYGEVLAKAAALLESVR